VWLFEGKQFEDVGDNYGFIYLITNTINGKKYIGRKYFTKASSRQVKGKRKKTRKESDWKDYYGSSPRLLEDINKHGVDNFKREILRLCKTRGETNYWEVKYQFRFCVLESDQYYNDNIAVKFTRRNIGNIVETV
jgi:hypothetical protein